MSRHEGVSCDSCLKGNFRGKRYKCLICYDYDLCLTCYEAGATTNQHTAEHPMQCILARADFDLYYGGEAVSIEQPQSFTCPFCGKMGFNEPTLQEHVTSEHVDTSTEVVCPICAALPGGDPNQQIDDFAAHLSLEHRAQRDLISFADEPSGSRHVRRIPHPGRGVTGTRARRTNMHFNTSGGLASLSPSSNRESMDPIAELLSQLSGVRRSTAQSNTSSQLQQLQVQLQLERQQAQASRQQLERLPRRQIQPGAAALSQPAPVHPPSTSNSHTHSQFLLSRCADNVLSEGELEALEFDRSDRSLFVQDLFLHTLAENLTISSSPPAASCCSPPPEQETSPAAAPSQSKLPVGQAATNKKTPVPCKSSVPAGKPSSTLVAPSRFNSPSVREINSSPAPANSRAPIRPTSPSTRRKIQRHVENRNHPNEPPPPH